jgi:hypothetical protein
MCVKEGDEIQTERIDNIFNRKIAGNFPNFRKERVMLVQEAYRAPI